MTDQSELIESVTFPAAVELPAKGKTIVVPIASIASLDIADNGHGVLHFASDNASLPLSPPVTAALREYLEPHTLEPVEPEDAEAEEESETAEEAPLETVEDAEVAASAEAKAESATTAEKTTATPSKTASKAADADPEIDVDTTKAPAKKAATKPKAGS